MDHVLQSIDSCSQSIKVCSAHDPTGPHLDGNWLCPTPSGTPSFHQVLILHLLPLPGLCHQRLIAHSELKDPQFPLYIDHSTTQYLDACPLNDVVWDTNGESTVQEKSGDRWTLMNLLRASHTLSCLLLHYRSSIATGEHRVVFALSQKNKLFFECCMWLQETTKKENNTIVWNKWQTLKEEWENPKLKLWYLTTVCAS